MELHNGRAETSATTAAELTALPARTRTTAPQARREHQLDDLSYYSSLVHENLDSERPWGRSTPMMTKSTMSQFQSSWILSVTFSRRCPLLPWCYSYNVNENLESKGRKKNEVWEGKTVLVVAVQNRYKTFSVGDTHVKTKSIQSGSMLDLIHLRNNYHFNHKFLTKIVKNQATTEFISQLLLHRQEWPRLGEW